MARTDNIAPKWLSLEVNPGFLTSGDGFSSSSLLPLECERQKSKLICNDETGFLVLEGKMLNKSIL